MNPKEIISNAIQDGVSVKVDGADGLELAGIQSAVEKWLPVFRERKFDILAALASKQRYSPSPCLDCHRLEFVEIRGKDVAGCLYSIPGAEFPDGWKRIADDLEKCLWPTDSKQWH